MSISAYETRKGVGAIRRPFCLRAMSGIVPPLKYFIVWSMRGSRIWAYYSFLGMALLTTSTPVIAAYDICARLAAFHKAPFDQLAQPAGRRWVEMHWRGHWMDFDKGFGKECRSSPDSASEQFCSWLTQNSSTEFPTYLPIRMLRCLGYRFPTGAGNEWSGWKSDVSTLSNDRWLLLEIDLLTFKTDTGAIRLSSFAADKDQWTVEMLPLTELPH